MAVKIVAMLGGVKEELNRLIAPQQIFGQVSQLTQYRNRGTRLKWRLLAIN